MKLSFQGRILLLTFVTLAPAWVVATVALWFWDAAAVLRWSLFLFVTLFALSGAFVVQRRMIVPLQSLANLLEALREGDYSLRGRNIDPRDAVGEVMVEVNSLSKTLHEQRLHALEAGVLLEKVIAEVDLAVFAFDGDRRLRLVNRAGERLLDKEAPALLWRDAESLGLNDLLDKPSGRILAREFPGGSGRWEVRRRSFREDGRPHELLVISELSRALREEERQAWQRLVRVIGHELNNSLAPIKSMAGTLRTLVARNPLPDDWRDDAASGLAVIGDRAEALGRFMGAYAQLARLPAPRRSRVAIADVVERVVSLVGSGRINVIGGPQLIAEVDGDQLEQVLINLVKNAMESDDGDGTVQVRWIQHGRELELEVVDEGPGIARTENLWVPFFTTKPGGTGIGLVLCREIVENHGGRIVLDNRPDTRGAIARVTLPL